MLISLLASVKTSMYSFVNNQLIFLKFEKSNTNTLILRFTVPMTTSEEVWDHFFTNIQMETKFTFTHYTNIYHHQELGRIRFLIQCSASQLLWLRSCKMVGIPFCVVSSLINVLNKANRVYKTCTT